MSGKGDFTAEQVAFSERFHKRAVDLKPMAITEREGPVAVANGCRKCREVGRPNKDGSIGSFTARHAAPVELARTPETCGECHMGPDHSQVEIYHESKRGVLFNAHNVHMNCRLGPGS